MIQKLKKCRLFLFACLLCMIMAFGVGSVMNVKADTDDAQILEPEDWSLYTLSSTASAYLSSATSPVGQGAGTLKQSNANSGNAGAFVGYIDANKTNNVVNWLYASLSNSSITRTYDSYKNLLTGRSSGSNTNSVYAYCRYGYLLSSLGLDDTGTSLGFNFGRSMGGYVIIVFYIFASVTPLLFSLVINWLQAFNPFAWFSLASANNDYAWAESVSQNDVLYSLAKTVSEWYDALYNMSWMVIVPIFFLALVVSLLLFNRTNKVSKVKKYVIRILFIVIGVPVCGSLYTAALNSIGTMTSNASSPAVRVVASTFCDFEAWAENTRLAIPSGATFVSEGDGSGEPSDETKANLRKTCMAINQASGIVTSNMNSISTVSTASDIAKWNTDNMTKSDNASYKDFKRCLNMLLSYTNGDFYQASDWDTLVKARLSKDSQEDVSLNNEIINMINQSDDIQDYYVSASGATDVDVATNRFQMSQWASTNDMTHKANIFGNGSMSVTYTSNDDGEFVIKYNGDSDISQDGSSVSVAQGLSTLSLYNYLNTSFNSVNMISYSSEKASSGMIRESHYSVNLIGTGVNQFLYYFNTLTLLGSFVVIGVFYALSMFFTSLKRGIRMIAAIPFAVLGSIRSIAKVITYAIMMIIEVIGTMFVYVLIEELLMSLSTIIEGTFARSVDSTIATMTITSTSTAMPYYAFLSSGTMITVMLILSCICYIVFTVIALRLRKTIIKAIDEGAASIIDKFLDVNGSPMGEQPSTLKRAAGSLASGAGMGVSQRVLNQGNGSGKSSDEKSVGASGTQRTIATGDGATGPSGPSGADGGGGQDVIEGEKQEQLEDKGVSNVTNNAGDNAQLIEESPTGGMSGVNISGGDNPPNISGGDNPPGAGSGISMATDMAFNDSSEEEDRNLGESLQSLSGMPNADNMNAQESVKQNEMDSKMDEALGKHNAVTAEEDAEKQEELKRKEQLDAVENAGKGAVQTAVGLAEIAGASESGDMSLAKDGLDNTVKGLDKVKGSGERIQNADTKAAEQVEEERRKKDAEEVAARLQQNALENNSGDGVPSNVFGSTGNSNGEPNGPITNVNNAGVETNSTMEGDSLHQESKQNHQQGAQTKVETSSQSSQIHQHPSVDGTRKPNGTNGNGGMPKKTGAPQTSKSMQSENRHNQQNRIKEQKAVQTETRENTILQNQQISQNNTVKAETEIVESHALAEKNQQDTNVKIDTTIENIEASVNPKDLPKKPKVDFD